MNTRLAFLPYDGHLAGWFGHIIHDVTHPGDLFDDIGHIVKSTLPALAAAGGFIVGGPEGAVMGFRLGTQVHDMQQAKAAGKDAEKEYQKAAALANYLASAGVDISGKDASANALIQSLTDDDYDYESAEAQQRIATYVEAKRAAVAATQRALLIAGAVLAGGLLLVSRRRA